MSKLPQSAASIVAYLICIIAVPVALTLNTVEIPATVIPNSDNPTPLGYTISLSLFLFPMAGLFFWMLRYRQLTFQKRAFLYTIVLLAPVSIFMDIMFGNQFFVFENRNAVLGIYFPAVGGPLPIEEIVFYIAGITTVLLIYVWCDECWLEKYNVPNYAAASAKIDKLLQFYWPSVIIGCGLILLAVIYKKLFRIARKGCPGILSTLQWLH